MGGLTRLKKSSSSPLSNGNIALATNMAKQAALVVPEPSWFGIQTGPGGVPVRSGLSGSEPSEVMMVAVSGRRAPIVGLKTAFVPNPPNGDRARRLPTRPSI